jgi:hypothetical protein
MKYFIKEAKKQTRYYVTGSNDEQSYRGFAKDIKRSDRVISNLSSDFKNIKREKITASTKGDMQTYLQSRIRAEKLTDLKSHAEKNIKVPTKVKSALGAGIGGSFLGGILGAGLVAAPGVKAKKILKGLGIGAAVGGAAVAPFGAIGSARKQERKKKVLKRIQTHIDINKRLGSISDVKIEKM